MAEGGFTDVMLKVSKRNKLLDQFQVMKDQEYLPDFLLKVDDNELPCHKKVLATRSEYFRRLFSHDDIVEVRQGFVNFPTFSFPGLKLVVEYCCSGILVCDMDEAKDVIEIIEHLQIPNLKSDLSDLIVNRLTGNNSIGWYFFANLYEITAVKTRAHETMYMDFSNVVRSPEFLALEFDDLVDYIIWQDMNHSTSLIAAARWTMHDCEQRRNKFQDILRTINVNQCSASALKHIYQYGLIWTDMDKYGLQSITPLVAGEAREFYTEGFSDHAPDWQGPLAGCRFLVLGGIDRQSWMINLHTGETTIQRTYHPMQILRLFMPMKYTFKEVLFADLALRFYRLRDVIANNSHCIIYKAHDCRWARKSELPTATDAAAVCQDLKVYVIWGAGHQERKMDCLDRTTIPWSTCPDLLRGFALPVAGCVGHSIYVIFSLEASYRLTARKGVTLQCLDTRTSSWSFKASPPDTVEKTNGAITVTIGHRLFVIGGYGKTCLSYDTSKDDWTLLTPTHKRHCFGIAIHITGKIILCGGYNEEEVPSDVVESYNPVTNAWELRRKLKKPLVNLVIIHSHK